jgi:protein-S-isoprenylcysteine O-methyltransferase Ste14
MNSLFVRAVLAVLALPGVVAFGVPVLLIARGSTVEWRMAPLAAAAPLLSLGIGLLLWCVREFYVAGRGTLAPWEPPRHLVTSGPYRVSRNPMYVAVLLILLGWAVLFGSWAVVVYAGAVAPIVHLRVLYHEEPYLARTHGDAWKAYATRVPRWIGLVRRREQASQA